MRCKSGWEMMTPLPPLLIISDAVSSQTGLGRITRDIAMRADAYLKDVCRVATLGCGGPGSRKFNFFQYAIEGMGDDFVIPNLPEVWEDWAGNDPGVILFIWDASRLGWFSRPTFECQLPPLKHFLTTARFRRWIYAPVDGEGPNASLTYPVTQSLLGFDRVLAYGRWAEGVLGTCLGEYASVKDLSSIPHGIDSGIFYERDRTACREEFLKITGAKPVYGQAKPIIGDTPLIGTVATNQARKDWGLWAETCALFLKRDPRSCFWIHTDTFERYWSIPALLVDFGLIEHTVISLGHLDDEQMARAYSACDLTLGIGAGEGFGYPLAESLFCGTPAIHGKYAGGCDFMDEELLINPVVFHLEGVFASSRPVYHASDWADRMERLMGKRILSPPDQLTWRKVWPRFEEWFRRGLAIS
jgi:glycosyltransferase involved in cell wall biosynthesis